jgi:hypothetical protein
VDAAEGSRGVRPTAVRYAGMVGVEEPGRAGRFTYGVAVFGQ